MGEELYNVIFNGTILPGQDKEDVKKKFAKVFKVDQKKIESYFSSKPILIKSKVNKQVCAQYKAAFKKAGAECIIRPVNAAKAGVAKPTNVSKGAKPENFDAKAAPIIGKGAAKPVDKVMQPQKPAHKTGTTQKASSKLSTKVQPGRVAKLQKTSSQASGGTIDQKSKTTVLKQRPKSSDSDMPFSKEPDIFVDIKQKHDQDTSSTSEVFMTQEKQHKGEGQNSLNAWNGDLDDTSDELDQLFSSLTTNSRIKDSQKHSTDIEKIESTDQFDDVQNLFDGYDEKTLKEDHTAKKVSENFQYDLKELFSSLSSDKNRSNNKAGPELNESTEDHIDESTQLMMHPNLLPDKTNDSYDKEEENKHKLPSNVSVQHNGTKRREETDRTIEAPPFFDSKDLLGSLDEAGSDNKQSGLMNLNDHVLLKKKAAFETSTGKGAIHSKTKKTALLLAIGTASFAWLYTYEEDKKKFLINIGLSIITGGLWILGAWIWAIIDTAKRSEEFYESIEEDDKLGLIALVTGILGLFGYFIPAIVCGYVHLSRVKMSGGKLPGKGLAMVGLILGIVSALIFVAFTVLAIFYSAQILAMFFA